MELTRRDALAALAASGVTVGAGVTLGWDALRGHKASNGATSEASDAPVAFTEREQTTLTALARTLYPTAVTGVPAFTETYVVGRVRDRPVYADGVKTALATLDEYATEWFDGGYRTLSTTDRNTLLRQMGLASAAPHPTGSDPERLRYYLVNELLYALYSSPSGGALVGIENPVGYPGGIESYRQGPSA
jgi:hypothetical protein